MTDPHEPQATGPDQETGPEAEESRTTAAPPDKPINGFVCFFAGLIISAAIGWLIWPTLFYSVKAQPFQFNHLAHTEEAGMDCEECHRFGDDGRFSGAPRFEECLECHTHGDRQNEENAAETAFLDEFVSEDDELIKSPDWLIYSGQPDCVFFSHIAHTKMGGFECEECHGDHGSTQSLRPMQRNRLTGYSRDVFESMKMTDCAACHTKHGKPENNACFVCHK